MDLPFGIGRASRWCFLPVYYQRASLWCGGERCTDWHPAQRRSFLSAFPCPARKAAPRGGKRCRKGGQSAYPGASNRQGNSTVTGGPGPFSQGTPWRGLRCVGELPAGCKQAGLRGFTARLERPARPSGQAERRDAGEAAEHVAPFCEIVLPPRSAQGSTWWAVDATTALV